LISANSTTGEVVWGFANDQTSDSIIDVCTITEEGTNSSQVDQYYGIPSLLYPPAIATYNGTVVTAWIVGTGSNGAIVAAQQTDSGFNETILLECVNISVASNTIRTQIQSCIPDPANINLELGATVWVVVYPMIWSCSGLDADVSFYQYTPR
jgi:hypothetical protein